MLYDSSFEDVKLCGILKITSLKNSPSFPPFLKFWFYPSQYVVAISLTYTQLRLMLLQFPEIPHVMQYSQKKFLKNQTNLVCFVVLTKSRGHH